MNSNEQGINIKNLIPPSEGQAIETPAEVVETPKQPEKLDDLEYQGRMSRKWWGNFTDAIIQRDYQSGHLEDDLSWFVEKFQKTKKTNNGFDAGGWTHMAFDLAFDKKFGQVIDEYQGAEVIEPDSHEPIVEERDVIIADSLKKDKRFGDDPLEQDKVKARVLFLEKLLNQTTKLLSTPREQQDKNQKEIIISLWSTIFARFVEMRVQAGQERLKELLPEINKIKQGITDYLREHYSDIVSPEGLNRVKDVQIRLGDEYLESGTPWTVSASYAGDITPPSLKVSGLRSLNREKFKKTLTHELLHAASGHGVLAQPKAEKEEADQHIVARRRVGLSGDKQNRWLNEALTEELCGRVNNIPEDELTYPLERQTLKILLERQGIREEDLMRWYFTEGDDEVEKQKLNSAYPDFFPKLDLIQKMSKGGKTLERLQTEDMAEFVKAIF